MVNICVNVTLHMIFNGKRLYGCSLRSGKGKNVHSYFYPTLYWNFQPMRQDKEVQFMSTEKKKSILHSQTT